MKKFRRMMALVIAMVMVVAMSIPAMATDIDVKSGEGNFKVTVENKDKATHTYEAYQIFKGDISGTETDGSTTAKLSNIEWGDGVVVATLISNLKTKFGSSTIDMGIANPDADPAANYTLGAYITVAEGIADAQKQATAFSEIFSKLSDEANAEALAQVVGASLSTTATQGDNTGVAGLKAGYYLVKDKAGTIAENSQGAYTQFILQVVGNQKVTQKADVPSVDKTVQDNETAATDDEWDETADHKINESFQFKLDATIPGTVDLAAFKTNGQAYKVEFTDTMSDGVTYESIASVTVTDSATTPHSVTLNAEDYSTTVTDKQAGGSWKLTIADLTATKYASLDTSTAIHVVVVYNAHLNENAIVSNKSVTDGNSSNSKANENTVKLTYSNNPNATGDDTENTTPEDHVFVFSYKIDNIKKIDTEDGTALAGAGFKIYAKGSETALKLIEITPAGSTVKKYRLKTTEDTAEGIEEMTSQSDGTFNIVGLDVGEYVIKETTTPAGYTTAEDIAVKIAATHAENSSTTGADLTLANDATGLDNIVIDKSGAVLPSTGGIGTTIFYVIGAILVVGAGILLVTRRRMNAN